MINLRGLTQSTYMTKKPFNSLDFDCWSLRTGVILPFFPDFMLRTRLERALQLAGGFRTALERAPQVAGGFRTELERSLRIARGFRTKLNANLAGGSRQGLGVGKSGRPEVREIFACFPSTSQLPVRQQDVEGAVLSPPTAKYRCLLSGARTAPSLPAPWGSRQ